MQKEQSIKTLVRQQTELLPNLQQKLQQLASLNLLWQKHVDINLVKYSRVANWRDNCLIIEVDSSAWATRLRYALPDLLAKLKLEKELTGIKYIEWYIQPETLQSAKPTPRKPKPISATTASMIYDAAEYMSNAKLKKALLTLADHYKHDK